MPFTENIEELEVDGIVSVYGVFTYDDGDTDINTTARRMFELFDDHLGLEEEVMDDVVNDDCAICSNAKELIIVE